MDDKQKTQILDIISIAVQLVPVLTSLITAISQIAGNLELSEATKQELINKIKEAQDEVMNLPEIL